MTEKIEPQSCYATIDNGYSHYQCGNKASVVYKGKAYCKIHDPEAKERRRQARQVSRDLVKVERELAAMVRRNREAAKAADAFVAQLAKGPWFKEFLTNMSRLADANERARQAVALLGEQARQWKREEEV